MNRPHFRGHLRLVDPELPSRLDRLDGLPGRGDAQWPDRYDVQWPDVRAAEVGGDLAAMAAPWPGMARDALGVYAEPVVVDLTAEQIDAIREGDPTPPDRYGVGMCVEGDRFLCTLPKGHPGRQHVAAGMKTVVAVWPADLPRGRHRQTDPLDLILADLRDLDGLS